LYHPNAVDYPARWFILLFDTFICIWV